jgi:hypothetical protein
VLRQLIRETSGWTGVRLSDGRPVTPRREQRTVRQRRLNDVYQNRNFARRGHDRARLGSAALSPAKANYDYCSENPSAVHCPGNFDVTKEPFYTAPHASRGAYIAPEHQPRHPAHHHG